MIIKNICVIKKTQPIIICILMQYFKSIKKDIPSKKNFYSKKTIPSKKNLLEIT